MLKAIKGKKANVFGMIFAALVVSGIYLTGCSTQYAEEAEEGVWTEKAGDVSFKFDENNNPNLIYHLTNGREELNENEVTQIEFRTSVPSDNSEIQMQTNKDGAYLVDESDEIKDIMFDLSEIYVEMEFEDAGTYDSAIEIVIYPDYYGFYGMRIKRNIQDGSYLIQTYYGDAPWGKVVEGQEICEELFALCEENNIQLYDFEAKAYEEEAKEESSPIYLWNSLVASDVESIYFDFGQTIEDKETIERITADLSGIAGVEMTREEFLNSYSPNVTIKIKITGSTPENTYTVYLKRNTDHNLYWVEKVVDKGGWDETTELKVVEGFDAFEDLWLFYSGCQDEYLNIVR